jgi:uncharacterized membrane protein YbhN (UPF0104 family)
MNDGLRKKSSIIQKWGGGIILFAAVGFLAHRFWQTSGWSDDWRLSPALIWTMIACALGYSLNSFFSAIAWRRLLLFFGQSDAPRIKCLAIYARTQIARYLPGNVLHLPSRHLAGRNLGFGHVPLVGAAMYEIVGILVGAGTLAFLGYIIFGLEEAWFSGLKMAVLPVALFVLPLLVNRVALIVPGLKNLHVPDRTARELFGWLFPVFVFYLFYFIGLGFLFVSMVFVTLDEAPFAMIGPIITFFAIAVMAGFVTPGAPGGMGVREALIVSFLTPYLGDARSLFIALTFRVVTIAGDFLFFLSSFALQALPDES